MSEGEGVKETSGCDKTANDGAVSLAAILALATSTSGGKV